MLLPNTVPSARRRAGTDPVPWSRHAAFGKPAPSLHEPAGAEAGQWPAMILGGTHVDLMGFDDAVRVIMAGASQAGPPLAVCSANLDHIRHFGTGGRWSGTLDGRAVRWLTLIDGAPLSVQARRLTGIPWPRLAGSDLVEPILAEAEKRGHRVGFLGGTEAAQHLIRERFSAERPGLEIAGWWAPERSVIGDRKASHKLARDIAASAPDILVVGLGKPRQELWINEFGHLTGAKVLLAFGAVVDFLAGHIRRAPEWVADNGLEWAWRLMLEPKRLARRYLVDGPEAYVRLRRDSGVGVRTGSASRPLGAAAAIDVPGHAPGSFAAVGQPADVAVIVVTYNNADDIGPLIDSLRPDARTATIKVVVADNSPDHRTVEALGKHPDVMVVRTGGNLGYAGGINVAVQAAGSAAAYLILNPDLRVEVGAIAAMRRRMDRMCHDQASPGRA